METLESSATALRIDATARTLLSESMQLAFSIDPQERARPTNDNGT